MPDSPTQGLFTDSFNEMHESSSSRCVENSARSDVMDHDNSVVVVDDSPKRQPIPVIDLTSPEHESDIVTSTPDTTYSEISSSRDRSVLMRRLELARNRLAELRARRIEQLDIFPRSESFRTLPRFLQDDDEYGASAHLSLQEARHQLADLRARRERALDLFFSNSPRSGSRLTMPSRTHRRRGRFNPYSFIPNNDPSSSTVTDSQPSVTTPETLPLSHSSPITVPDDDSPAVIDVDGNTTSEEASQDEDDQLALMNENIARITRETRDAIARARHVASRARETLERVRHRSNVIDDLIDRDSPLVNNGDQAMARNLQAQFDQEHSHHSNPRSAGASASAWNNVDVIYPPNVVHDGPILHSSIPHTHRRRYGRTSATAHLPDMLLPFISVFGHAPPPLHHFGEPENRADEYEALWNLSERIGQAKPRGLTRSDIDKIPSFRYAEKSKSQSNGSCVVCMMDYSYREKLRKLPCTHDFHSKCIDRWLKSNRTCPICRDEVQV